VPGIREERHETAVRAGTGAATGVVEVEVGQDDGIDVSGSQSLSRKGSLQPVAVVDVEHPVEVRTVLPADTGIDDDPVAAGDDEKRPQGEPNPVVVIGRIGLLPEDARHDAEHRPAVEPEEPVAQGLDSHGRRVRGGGSGSTARGVRQDHSSQRAWSSSRSSWSTLPTTTIR